MNNLNHNNSMSLIYGANIQALGDELNDFFDIDKLDRWVFNEGSDEKDLLFKYEAIEEKHTPVSLQSFENDFKLSNPYCQQAMSYDFKEVYELYIKDKHCAIRAEKIKLMESSAKRDTQQFIDQLNERTGLSFSFYNCPIVEYIDHYYVFTDQFIYGTLVSKQNGLKNKTSGGMLLANETVEINMVDDESKEKLKKLGIHEQFIGYFQTRRF